MAPPSSCPSRKFTLRVTGVPFGTDPPELRRHFERFGDLHDFVFVAGKKNARISYGSGWGAYHMSQAALRCGAQFGHDTLVIKFISKVDGAGPSTTLQVHGVPSGTNPDQLSRAFKACGANSVSFESDAIVLVKFDSPVAADAAMTMAGDSSYPFGATKLKVSLLNGESAARKKRKLENATCQLYFDGGSRGNPGPAGYGWVLFTPETVYRGSNYMGSATNNAAEYAGLVCGLSFALNKLGVSHLDVFGDSQLVINQMIGSYKCKSKNLQASYADALALKCKFEQISFSHVYRHINADADRMANAGMDRKLPGLKVTSDLR
jgi:ribonuclease HI